MAVITKPKTVDRKLVRITTSGPILPKGGIYGPTTPAIETVEEIALLLQKHYGVNEILADGTEVKLDITNYNFDLSDDDNAHLEGIKDPQDPITIDVTKDEDKTEETEEKSDSKEGAKSGQTDTATTVNSGNQNNNQSNKNHNQNNGKSTSYSKADKLNKK